MSKRKDFVDLAKLGETNFSKLCREFGVSRKTGYKWVKRHEQDASDLSNRSSRPKNSPGAMPLKTQEQILKIRKKHCSWGGRKIRVLLIKSGVDPAPAPSTINNFLRRNNLIDPEESIKHKKCNRFEAPAPNDLWQMDFKGHFPIAAQRCHPFTVLDDYSRYSICLRACTNQDRITVMEALRRSFRAHGLPRRILCDNGSPWGTSDAENPYTQLVIWMIRLGIKVVHSRPYHPQTLGKDERFHRTLKAEVLKYCGKLDIYQCQRRFDRWRDEYNNQRPHEALKMGVPGSRYETSPRQFPEDPPPIEYAAGDQVRRVHKGGRIGYKGREYRIGKAFRGEYIALRQTHSDGILEVFYCNQNLGWIDLKGPQKHIQLIRRYGPPPGVVVDPAPGGPSLSSPGFGSPK